MNKADRAALNQTLSPLVTSTMQDQVYREIKRQIMSGRFEPGRTLSMHAVADALGTSTMPVREAMRRLAAEHAVEIRPKRAISIPIMSRARVKEIIDIRIALEGLATEYAARNITDAEVLSLNTLAKELETAQARGDVRRYLAGNQAFHFAVYTAARSHSLMSMIESLWLQIGPIIGLYTDTALKVGSEYHDLIVEALRRRDAAEARAAMVNDIGIGTDYLLKHAGLSKAEEGV